VSRAELFYERAITLARRTRRWRTYVRAHLGKGAVKKALGDWNAARAHYYTAARAALSLSGEKWLAAQTQHDLLALAAEEGALEEALIHGRQALDWYPRHHVRIPALVHDLAFVLVRMGLFSPAVPLLSAVMRANIPPADQVIGWSTLARATAGSGDTLEYRTSAERVLRLVALFDVHAAAAFDNLAWGACFLGLWSDARQYAARSLEIAARRVQTEAIENARRALAAADTQTIPAQPAPSDGRFLAELQHLATDAERRLLVWRGPTWKRKCQSGPEQLGRI
jgi:tetratricopeptide (TPR) repeat protein